MGQWVPLELNPQRYVPVPKFHTNDGENCSCSKPPSVEAEAVLHTQCLCEAITDQGPVPWTILLLSAHHQSPPSQSPWKTQCAQRIRIGWMPVHGMAKHRPDVAVRCCAGLGAQSGELGASRASAQCGKPIQWSLPPPGLWSGLVPHVHEGTAWGERYCSARGEILRPLQDQLQRRRSAPACSSIKNESVGSEDDQTPS